MVTEETDLNYSLLTGLQPIALTQVSMLSKPASPSLGKKILLCLTVLVDVLDMQRYNGGVVRNCGDYLL